jgi:membrane-bound ClpP family serine protease
MGRKTYIAFSVSTGVLKALAIIAIYVWLMPMWGISLPSWVLIPVYIVLVIYEIATFRIGRKTLQRKAATPSEAIVGLCGKATTLLDPEGYVKVNGELWHALSNEARIDEGEDVVVVETDRLTLYVAPYIGSNHGSVGKIQDRI